ncbi:hypothetical protein C2845_PM02G12640 [Panicum miliaceum]|uniref:Uncharacterized protein n=1 Tax=Panicum miliaceum TaxID=4540 RepID=A0A3L6SIB0_PANMI|nr:hypothetical protein C2845_PM02G12640 [Panicum miliaceum]
MEQPFDAELWVKYIEMAADFGKEQPWRVELDGAAMGKLDDAGTGVPADRGAGRPRKGGTPPSQPNAAPRPRRRSTSRAGSSSRSDDRHVLCSTLAHRADADARPCRRREGGRVAGEAIADQSRAPPPVKSAAAAPSPTDSSNPRRGRLTTTSSCRW